MDQEFIYQRMSETVTPIFDEERGHRLRYMRMALMMDQKQLGEKLGVSQQAIAKLELAQIQVTRKPITLAKFYRVFGCATHHVLFGLDSETHNYEAIKRAYWHEKDRTKGDRTSTRLTRKQHHANLRRQQYRRLKDSGRLT